jgi:hypothetical protein
MVARLGSRSLVVRSIVGNKVGKGSGDGST